MDVKALQPERDIRFIIRRHSTEYEDFTEALVRDLIGGKLDVGIMSLPINNKLIVTMDLFTEPLLVASSRHHKLITNASVRVKELENLPFIAK